MIIQNIIGAINSVISIINGNQKGAVIKRKTIAANSIKKLLFFGNWNLTFYQII